MCFLTDDDEDVYDGGSMDPNDPSMVTSNSKRTGVKRWQCHGHHTWIIPRKPLMLIAAVAAFFLVIGILFLAIGGAVGSVGLKVVGGLMFGFGFCGLIICLLIFLHAFFYYGTKDQSTQTTETPWMDEMTVDSSGYTNVGRPSALKSPDSTLKRNGTLGVKKVTMAPELGPYGDVQSLNLATNNNNANPVSSAPVPLHRLPATGISAKSNSMPRMGYVDGSMVGAGGIKITPVDPNQPFPSPASSSISYGGSAGQYYSTMGGGSNASGSDTYAHPRSVNMGYDTSNSSQYSTLRSIPVTHISGVSQRDGHQKQTSYNEEVEYATVNKPVVKTGSTVVRVEHLPAQHGNVSSQGLVQHVHMGHSTHSSQRHNIHTEDNDYDNTVERTPMITAYQQQQQHQQLQQNNPNLSYHEKQMQFQQHHQQRLQQQQHPQQPRQQDLHAPRQVNTFSLQKQYAPNPFFVQGQQQEDQQMEQYKMHYEQEKKQQQQQLQTQFSKSSTTSSARNSMIDEVPEPQPLVYPSARRPMTFEQVSSSKMSVYDNVLANNLRENDELEG